MNSLEKAIVIIASLITIVYIVALLVLRVDNVIFATVIACLMTLAERLISKRVEKKKRGRRGDEA